MDSTPILFGIAGFGVMCLIAAGVGQYLERRDRRKDHRCFRCATLGGNAWTQVHGEWFCETCSPKVLARELPVVLLQPPPRSTDARISGPVN